MSFPPRVRRLIVARSGGVCEGCGHADATEMHHRKYKSRGGKDTPSNALHLCGWGNHTGCHGAAHSDDPPQGHSVHSWENPLHELVLYRGALVFLLDLPPWFEAHGDPPF